MMGHTNLTVESAIRHFEILEIGKSAPFRRDSTSKLVVVGIAITKIEHLERDWKLLGQLPCEKMEMSAKHCNACMLEHTNSPRN